MRAKLAVEEELMAVRAEQATREVESAIDKSKVRHDVVCFNIFFTIGINID